MFLIIRYNNQLKFKKNELFSQPIFNKSLVLTITIILVYIFVMMIVNHKGFWINSEIISCNSQVYILPAYSFCLLPENHTDDAWLHMYFHFLFLSNKNL